MKNLKIASILYPVMEEIKNRWSARAFSDKQLTERTRKPISEFVTAL